MANPVAQTIRAQAWKRYPSDRAKRKRYINTALATGLVESNLTEVNHGDADSLNWRQERAQGYADDWAKSGGPLNTKASVNRFFDELEQHDRGQPAGELAADVQRPREDLRGKYADRLGEANQIRRQLARSTEPPRSAGSGTRPTAGTVDPGKPARYIPGKTETDTRGAVIDALLQPGTGGLLKRTVSNVQSGAYTTETPTQIIDGKPARYLPGRPGTPGGPMEAQGRAGGGPVKKIVQDANLLDRANNAGKLPYLWGGGHAGKLARGSKPTPLDCSGAVSRVLGIDPRVSGDLAKWGSPGEGRRVTIYANADHVLLKIDGRYWGTSQSNPGGGAGWIPSGKISREYLSGFTARHPKGM